MLRTMLAAVLILSIPAAALADVTIIQKVQVKRQNMFNPAEDYSGEHVETVAFKGRKVRIDTKDQAEYKVADIEKGYVYFVNPERKTFSQVKLSELSKLRDVAFFQVQQRLDQLDSLTPEQKAAAEIMFGPMLKKMREAIANKDKKTKVEIKRPEEEKEIAGYKCKNVVVEEEGKPVVDVWLTDKLDVEVNLAEILSSMALFSPSVKEKLKPLEGFSLKTSYVFRFPGFKFTSSSEVVEVKTGEVPAEKFAIPKEYKKVESPIAQQIKQYDKWKKEQAEKEAREKEAGPEPQEQEKEPEKEEPETPPAPEPPKKDPGEESSK